MSLVRSALLTFAFGLLSVLIQGTVIKALFPGIIVPGLALILVVFLAFYNTSVFGAALAFALGLELDLCSGLLLGPWAGAFVAAYGVVALLSPRIFVESPVAIMLTVFFASLLASFAYLVVIAQVQHVEMGFSAGMFLEALLTALVCVPVIGLFRRCYLRSSASGRRLGAHA